MLFALDAAGTSEAPSGDGPPVQTAAIERVIADFWREIPGDAEGRAYADDLVRSIAADLPETDARIRAASQNWRLERMTRVDRNVLRLGAWELAHRAEVPRAVILDEAVEIAKRFGTEDSGAFVNGVLDRIADDCGRRDDDRPAGERADDPRG